MEMVEKAKTAIMVGIIDFKIYDKSCIHEERYKKGERKRKSFKATPPLTLKHVIKVVPWVVV